MVIGLKTKWTKVNPKSELKSNRTLLTWIRSNPKQTQLGIDLLGLESTTPSLLYIEISLAIQLIDFVARMDKTKTSDDPID